MSHCTSIICMMLSSTLMCACVEPPPPLDTQTPEDMGSDQAPPVDTGLDASRPLPDAGPPDLSEEDMPEPPVDMGEPCPTPSASQGNLRFLGEGTEQDPYKICTAQQVRLILLEEQERLDDDRGAHYELLQDIDMASVMNWAPIPCFRGTLNGNGYAIKHIRHNHDTYVGGCDETGGLYTAGFINEVAPGARIEHIRFEDFMLGARGNLLPDRFDEITDRPNNAFVGGIFGLAIQAEFSQIEVDGVEIWTKGFLGGVVHTSLDSNWTEIRATRIELHYEWGQIGGFARWFKTLRAPAAKITDIEIDARLIQEVPPATVDRNSHAYGLLFAQTEGPFTLTKATITGMIDHRTTPQGEQGAAPFVSYIGGIVGRTLDEVATVDAPDASPQEIERAKGLRELETIIEDVRLSGMTTPRCGEDDATCSEVSALVGRMGRSDTGGADPIDYAASPITVRDVELSDNTLSGQLVGAIVGRRLDGELTLERVAIHGNTLAPQDPTPDSCLVHRNEIEQEVVTMTLCALSSRCMDEKLEQTCQEPDLFSRAPWEQNTSPPRLRRD